MKYSRPALSINQQIAQLASRGMAFADRARGYWLWREADRTSHRFQPVTTFEDVLADYVFDRELRLLVLDAIERIEVSVPHPLGP